MIFLGDSAQGGDLIFPHVGSGGKQTRDIELCRADLAACCAQSVAKLSANKGHAIMLYSHGLNGKVDVSAEHAICPLLGGESWIGEWSFEYIPFTVKESQAEQQQQQPSVTFENTLSVPALVYWKPVRGGDNVLVGNVAANGELSLDTYHGHEFVIYDEGGQLLREVKVEHHVGRSWVQLTTSGDDL
eukprot:TRINITY_DN23938_c0_g2_i2.p1 TRINITY_DN23938_c0_g2~~TRINITY_DN23938_c0_g2_i2.p1  ORF type:complete len:187 (-),score=40.63 TRINITY_DN23938_c0_g2_i2:97-657(-)